MLNRSCAKVSFLFRLWLQGKIMIILSLPFPYYSFIQLIITYDMIYCCVLLFFFFFLSSGYGVFIVLFPVKSIQHHGFTQFQWGHYLSASVFVYEHFDFAYMAEFFKKPGHRFCFLLVFLAMQLYGLSSFCLCRSFKI